MDYFEDKEVIHTLEFPSVRVVAYPFKKLKLLSMWYLSASAEIDALNRELDILHHLYGENTLFLSSFKRLKKEKSVVVTFHHFPEKFTKIMPFFWKKLLNNLEKIIVVSPTQFRFFKKHLDESSLSLIPLGIDTTYFKPLNRGSKDFCLAVGFHERDFKTLFESLKIINKEIQSLKFIILSEKVKKVPKNLNLELLNKVSEERLLSLYQNAAFQILPLKEATANIALLEGMACGLPTIVPSLENVIFYTKNKGCLYYEKGNAQELAEKISVLAADESKRKKLGIEARKRAEALDWKKVVKELVKIYEDVHET